MFSPNNDHFAAIAAITKWYRAIGNEPFYLAGYAGTGKTSTVLELINSIGLDVTNEAHVRACAYTGKAGSVLRTKGMRTAATVSSMIYRVVEVVDHLTMAKEKADAERRGVPYSGEIRKIPKSIRKDAVEPTRLIVLDECSMVNQTMYDDLRYLYPHTKILFIGDVGQLPPVSGDSPFADYAPDFALTEIMRQDRDNPIVRLATMARGDEQRLKDLIKHIR